MSATGRKRTQQFRWIGSVASLTIAFHQVLMTPHSQRGAARLRYVDSIGAWANVVIFFLVGKEWALRVSQHGFGNNFAILMILAAMALAATVASLATRRWGNKQV